MTTYRPDAPETIHEIFDREGDALTKAGFKLPDMSAAPEDFMNRAVTPDIGGSLFGVLPSPLKEAARLGIGTEEYLEG